MKKLIGSLSILAFVCSTLLAGNLTMTVQSSKGQIKSSVREFRYSKSPRDLANASTASAAIVTAQPSAAPAAGGRAAAARATRRSSEPVTVVLVEPVQFFVTAAMNGETLPSVVFEFTRKTDNGEEVYQTVRLTNAIVSSAKLVDAVDRPAQEISFTFQKIEYSHKDGAAAAPDTWN